jgi:serine/threonine-protein kinase RsbW
LDASSERVLSFDERHVMEAVPHKIQVPANTAKLSELREGLTQLCEDCGVPPKTMRRMILAIDEAVANVIEHAHLEEQDRQIDLSLEVGEEKIVAEICDRGVPFDPCPHGAQPDHRSYPRRGFGLYLIHMIADSVEYQRTNDGQNVLTLTMNLT